MTLPATTRRAGPFSGNGVTTAFPFTFKVFAASDIQVVKAVSGVQSTLVLGSDYTVTLNGDQDANPGGTVTYTSLASGQTLSIAGALAYDQTLDLPSGGNFSPIALENALDRIEMQIQQVNEATGRSLTLPLTSSSASTTLPAPAASKIIGWNAAATELQNYDTTTLASIVAYGTANSDIFSGTGSQTTFTLSANPASINNLDVSVGGVSQRPGLDYLWTSGTTVTFTTAPPSGTNNVLVRYMQALAFGSAAGSDVSYTPAGTGAVATSVQSKLRESVSAQDFGAVGDGATNDTSKVLAALTASNVITLAPGKNYKLQDLALPDKDVTIFAYGATITCGGTYGAFIRRNKGYHTKIFGGKFYGTTPGFAYISNEGVLPQNQNVLEYTIVDSEFYQNSGVYGIWLYGCREGRIERCRFVGNAGIYQEITINSRVINCDWRDCQYMINARPGVEGLYVIAATALECDVGIAASRVDGVFIQSCMLDYLGQPVFLSGCDHVNVTGNYLSIRAASTSPVILANDYSGYYGNYHVVESNVIRINAPTTITTTVSAVYYSYTNCVRFNNNKVEEYSLYGVNIIGCTFFSAYTNTVLPKSGYGTNSFLSTTGDTSTNKIYQNTVTQAISKTTFTDSVWQNIGFTTEAANEAVIPNAASSVVVTHGLSYTPVNWQISLTPTTNTLLAVWVSAITSTTFTISSSSATSGALGVGWKVQNKL